MESQLDFIEKYRADDKTKCFVDCEELQENTAKFNFEDNTLKLDKTNLSREQLKRISLVFATDLKNFAEADGKIQNLTTKEVYSHLQNNKYNNHEKKLEILLLFSYYILKKCHLNAIIYLLNEV